MAEEYHKTQQLLQQRKENPINHHTQTDIHPQTNEPTNTENQPQEEPPSPPSSPNSRHLQYKSKTTKVGPLSESLLQYAFGENYHDILDHQEDADVHDPLEGYLSLGIFLFWKY